MPTDTPLDLDALLQAAKRGDRKALEPLFASIRPLLKNRAANIAPQNRRHWSEFGSDFVQETLMTMFQRFGDFQGETVKQLLSWATTILGNVYLMEMRRLYAAKRDVRRQEPLERAGRKVDVMDPHAEEPVDQLVHQEASTWIALQTRRLPRTQRIVLTSWIRNNEDVEKVAAELDVTPSAAYKSLERAWQALRDVSESAEVPSWIPSLFSKQK